MHYRKLLNAIGLSHTLLCGGIVFGWSSLEHVFRQEKLFSNSTNDTLLFSVVFTFGVMGVYLSNIVFGTLMDRRGAKLAGSLASLGFGIGLLCCSFAVWSGILLCFGFFLLGICGPAIQLTTIPFSGLFDGYRGVTIRSLQAATFDGSSVIFYVARLMYDSYHISSHFFFLCALSIPFYTFICEITMWPVKSLEQYQGVDDGNDDHGTISSTGSEHVFATGIIESDNNSNKEENDSCTIEMESVNNDETIPPIETILLAKIDNSSSSSSSFPIDNGDYYENVKTLVLQRNFVYLVLFTSIHGLKLNFIIVSINAQLTHQYQNDSEQSYLLFYFGLILPFGFLFLPVSTWLLNDHREVAFQVANTFGLIYGITLMFNVPYLQIFVAFPMVSVSRQLVYSTVFQEVASSYGFQYFGTLMGIINIIAGIIVCVQFALVALAESQESYFIVNIILISLGLPLFFRVFFLKAKVQKCKSSASWSDGLTT